MTELQRIKDFAHLCRRLGRSKASMIKGGVDTSCIRQLWSKALREVWDIAPMFQWLLVSQTLKKGWLPVHRNGRHLISARASQQGGCTKRRSSRIVATHNRQLNGGVVLIHQYYQQIIRWRAQLLICCARKIEKNATIVRKSRYHNNIRQLMKENFGFQMSCYHLSRIKIIFACWVWHFINLTMKHYWSMWQEGNL